MFINEEIDYYSIDLAEIMRIWGFCKETIKVLENEPEMVEYLASKRHLPPFPKGYKPLSFEVRFEDGGFYYHERGKLPYIRKSEEGYKPAFTEYLIDDEILVFKVGSDVIIDRSENLTAKDFDGIWPEYKLPFQFLSELNK